jgi:hypothetical protein
MHESEFLELIERQTRWQKQRKDLPWPEKIRMVERVREDAARWLLSGRKGAEGAGKVKTEKQE